MNAPLIVTAELGRDDFAWLQGLRRKHYPADRNQVPAHLTLFRTLPPSAEAELRHLLASLASRRPPEAFIGGVMDLGGGVALRVASRELDALRAEIAHRLSGVLTLQDSAGWQPHVTIQNKVPPQEARGLRGSLGSTYDGRPLRVAGLGLHRYLGGPWETVRVFPFRG